MADTWEEQREAVRQRWGFDAIYADYRAMLEETKPDIVSVCTSAKPRASILIDIAKGGYGVKAVWAEKPITLSLQEADDVITAYNNAGIAIAVNCTRRWKTVYTQALRMVQDGVVGDIRHIAARAAVGLSHNGSHMLTTLTMFAPGRAQWVVGEMDPEEDPDSNNDFKGSGYIGFPGGVRGYFRAQENGPDDWSYDITGTDGMLRIMGDGRSTELWTCEAPIVGQRNQQAARRLFPAERQIRAGGINVIHDLLECIETGATPKCSGEDAREALEIAIATRLSHRRGIVRVDLPVEDRREQIVSAEVVSDGDVPRAISRKRLADDPARRSR
jgi:myo-inositol 2-dehydrogenase/D-chiro-inositol 1-dehydrogenase